MSEPEPQKEPSSETEEKKSILKTHEEFIDDNRPSMTKQEYEKEKERKRLDEQKKSPRPEEER